MKMLLGPWPPQKPLAELRRAYPDVEIVEAPSREAVLALIADADAFFGVSRFHSRVHYGAERI